MDQRKARSVRLLVVLIATVLLIVYLYGTQQPSGPAGGETAPLFSGTQHDGAEFSLQRLRGKPVLLVFYATWCPKCNEELPELVKLHQRFGDHGLQMAAIWTDPQNRAELDARIARHKPAYPFVRDEGMKIAELYEVSAFPTLVLIDGQGRVVGSWTGGGSRNREAVEDELNLLVFDRR